ncbi:hypothetical protein NDU88_005474 [Pleurodeles waltl]|uniref:Uncharacterized protein n=1 Tax=Pleurodeles waltl TaxID=8319 RepID=A0AAV7PKH0_PLEWA|nr:hypothetical protein NDU88_005474 [Pleurodeles waltl]
MFGAWPRGGPGAGKRLATPATAETEGRRRPGRFWRPSLPREALDRRRRALEATGPAATRKRFIASAQGRVSLLKPFKLVTGVPVDERHNYVVTKDRPRRVPSTQMRVSCLP